jgi:hypothetical protein
VLGAQAYATYRGGTSLAPCFDNAVYLTEIGKTFWTELINVNQKSRITWLLVTGAMMCSSCTPTRSLPNISSRDVPNPLSRSGQDIENDSLVRIKWLCRSEIPDPLSGQDDGPKVRFEATLYGEDLIAAEALRTCASDSIASDTCVAAARSRYRDLHDDQTRVRIRLNLQSSFSVNSLNARFWDIYVKDDRDIALEPVAIIHGDPVVVREDSLPEPGRAPARSGLYQRAIDLYFPMKTPFGAEVLGPSTREVRLYVSQNRKELTSFAWHVHRDGDSRATRERRRNRSPSGF